MSKTFSEKIENYFSGRLGWREVRVSEARRLTGGISRETWMISLECLADDGTRAARGVILRLDPSTSLLASNRKVEYALYRAFRDVPGVPVPAAICDEDDAAHLGAPFMATAALPGVADIPSILAPAFVAAGPSIAREIFRVLGAISLADPRRLGVAEVLAPTTPETAWADQLSHWEGILKKDGMGPAPVTSAAIRRLKRKPPPPSARISVVHGDYRLGNCLFLPDGTVSGVLDWEMAHLGDPLEDLAWALMPDWRPRAARDKVAGHLRRDEAIRGWEAASGLQVDGEALDWWKLFSCVKCAVIFTTGGCNYLRSPAGNLIYAAGSWGQISREEARMMELMGVEK